MEKRNTIKRLTESALLLAIAVVLELVSKLLELDFPFGETITLASMFPVVLISYRYGVKWGLLSGFTCSLLQMIMDAKVVSAMFLPGEGQMAVWQAICVCLLDYVLAYTILGVGGMFKGKFKKPALELALGVFVALLFRWYIVYIISGAIFYGAWAEQFFSQEGFYKFYKIGESILGKYSGTALSIVYLVFYNGLNGLDGLFYMVPGIIITTVVAAILGNVPQITGVKNPKKDK